MENQTRDMEQSRSRMSKESWNGIKFSWSYYPSIKFESEVSTGQFTNMYAVLFCIMFALQGNDNRSCIHNEAGEFHISSLFYENFANIVTNACKPKYTIFRNKKFHFNQDEHLFDIPTMVVLVGKDGSCDHAISVYKDMIFDTSHEKILRRNSETLDWCCPPLGFQQILRAYSLMEIRNINKRKKQKNKILIHNIFTIYFFA